MKTFLRTLNRSKWGYIFVAPWIVGFFIFSAYPLWLGVKLSFMNYNLVAPQSMRFVGLQNWINGFRDPLFWQSMINIIYNQAITIILTFFIALAIAYGLFKISTGKKMWNSFFRAAYFLPTITSVVVVMLIFGSMLAPYGPLQNILRQIDILKKPIVWNLTPTLIMPVIAIINSWMYFGVQAIILLGGLGTIPTEYSEAARIDGAKERTIFWKIMFPLLRPQIIFIMVMNAIGGLQMFTQVYVNFGITGGVEHAGLTPVLYIYGQGLGKFQMGYASALGFILSIIIVVATIVVFKVLREKD